MTKLIRKTLTGNEYWNKKEKRIVFVPKGKSIVETAKETDSTELEDYKSNLEEMNSEQLQAFALKNDIDIPGTMKKEETIRNFIKENMNDKA